MSLIKSADGLGRTLGHVSTKRFFEAKNTVNYATQALALDANAWDIQSTGGAICFINGEFILALTGDAAFDISAGLQGKAWVSGSSYTQPSTSPQMRQVEGRQFVCILTHTAAAINKPLSGRNWRTYWKESDSTAINASGKITTYLKSRYVLVCADRKGELSCWLAGPQKLDADVVVVIPRFEAEIFCPIGLILVDAPDAYHEFGVTTLSGNSTLYQLINTPVYSE
jgi:hypothetical protein